MIEALNVTNRYAQTLAVDDPTFTVAPARSPALSGPTEAAGPP